MQQGVGDTRGGAKGVREWRGATVAQCGTRGMKATKVWYKGVIGAQEHEHGSPWERT